MGSFPKCKNEKNENSFVLNDSIFEKPFVPVKINWQALDTSEDYPQDKYSIFRTIYFLNDSIVYIFKSENDKKLSCIDTSIFSKSENTYLDTVSCKYDDSISFAIENVELFVGNYRINGNNIICDMKRFGHKLIDKNSRQDVFTDTLNISKQNGQITFTYKNEQYEKALNFTQESNNRLLEFIKL